MRATNLLDMAESLRRRAAEVTGMADYARKMLEAAAEAERLARLECAPREAEKRPALGTLRCIG